MLAGRNKGKQAGDKLPLLALQCLDALLRLGRTCEGVAELLQEVPLPADVQPPATSTGVCSSGVLSSNFHVVLVHRGNIDEKERRTANRAKGLQALSDTMCVYVCIFVCLSVCLPVCLEVTVDVCDVERGQCAGAIIAAQVVCERVSLLHQMLQALLQAGRGREAEVLTHTIAFVGGLLPTALHQGISQWALDACAAPVAQVRQQDYSCTYLHTTVTALGNEKYYHKATSHYHCTLFHCIHNIFTSP